MLAFGARPSLRGVLFLSLAVVVLGLAALAWHTYREVERELTAATHSQKIAVVRLAATTLADRFEGLIGLGVSLATRVRFRELVAAGQWIDAAQILRGVPADFPHVERLFLADAQGTLKSDVPELPGVRGTNFAHREWYAGVSKDWKPYVTSIYVRAAPPQKRVFAVAVPLRAPAGQVLGILVMQVNPDAFLRWIEDVDPGPDGTMLVLDAGGRIAHPSAAEGGEGTDRLADDAVLRALAGGGTGVVLGGEGRDGDALLYAFAPAARGWFVVARQPAAQAFLARDNQLRRAIAAFGAIFAFLAAGAALAAVVVAQARRANEDRRARDVLERQVEVRTRELADLYDNAPCGYHSVDADGRIVRMNATWLAWLGYTRDEVVGKMHHPDLMTPESAEQFRTKWFPLFKRQGWLKEVEFEYVRKDGSTFPGSLQTTAIHDEAGRYVMSRTVVFDISERKRVERQLREANAFLDSLVENIPDMIFVKDAADLRFVRFNRAGEDLLGHAQADLLGKNDYDFFPKDEADFFTAKDREVLAGGRIVDIPEEPLHTRQRGVRILHTKKIPVLDDAGRARYLLGISEDITERKEAEDRIRALNDELQARAAQLEAANKELGAFSYSVSHDLRSPLRAVDGYARMLEEDYGARLDDEGRRLLGVVRDEAGRMGRLIDDLLAFSRSGRQAMQAARLDMGGLVQEVLGELGPQHPAAQVSVGALPPATGDRALLRQVWVNLIGNALKYSAKATAPRVEIGGRANGAESEYWVKDNGAGFDPRYADKLFGVFQRLHGADEFPGTGVGLAIVQRVVARHGGRVGAEGRPGEGARFSFALPAREGEA